MLAVQPICLAGPGKNYENLPALVTGWGLLSSSGPAAHTLQEVNLTTISSQQCRNSYGYNRITDSMICAQSSGKDSCQGDSGGPLAVLGDDGRYSQVGIVSWGRGCAKSAYPGVYTRITALRGWIETTVTGVNN